MVLEKKQIKFNRGSPYSELELPNEDLPWAQVLLGVTDGSGACNRAKTPKIEQADTVLGFFLDGDNAQLPCILGVFGRTDAVSYSGPYSAPFEPFTGFSGPIKKSSAVVANESNESNLDSQKSPRMVSPEIAEKLNKDIKDPGKKERLDSMPSVKKLLWQQQKLNQRLIT